MKERDRKIVEAANAWVDKYYSNKVPGENIKELVNIINKQDKQLAEIVEAGEPFNVMADLMVSVPHVELLGRVYTYHPESEEVWFGLGISSVRGKHPFENVVITGKHFLRLAQALGEVKHE